ncbi:hypothetical protein [Streptomyces sp. UNOC14_S4]|uniref:hypothetical protein n=1 Tax=Streptomyces sp. UNOC14_S4 TaxID=2872340 RepID=UPI001E49A321|nr:hypothetical protein [Streptomyces sp. UNOC14_S4]MCC3767401.1 hypothetical protein [Streptomyces sp. UNOC14_S4]
MTERPRTPADHPVFPGTGSPRPGPAETPQDDGDGAAVDRFVERFGDRIDDRVAESFDELYAERLAESGPFQRAMTRERGIALTVVVVSLALGTLATVLTPGEVTTPLILWAGLVVVDLAYFFRPRRPSC